MTKLFLKSVIGCMLTFGIVLTSCSDDSFAEDTEISNFLIDGEARANSERGQCFELVFPVTITLADGTLLEVNDRAELKEAAKAQFEANGREAGRPDLVFPVDILVDGASQTIETEEDFAEIKKACKEEFGGRGGKRGAKRGWKGHRGEKCFSVNFPITLVFDDGTSVTIESKEDKRETLQTFKESNPDVEGRPSVQFPVDITLEDGSVQTIADEEALQALKETCRDNDDDDDSN